MLPATYVSIACTVCGLRTNVGVTWRPERNLIEGVAESVNIKCKNCSAPVPAVTNALAVLWLKNQCRDDHDWDSVERSMK